MNSSSPVELIDISEESSKRESSNMSSIEVSKESNSLAAISNDLSIINKCTNSISMGNANERVKSNSKYITESVYNDGVSEAISKIILPRLKVY